MAQVRTGPAIGLVEVASIARGMVVLDAMVKRAPCDVVDNWTASPGKYLVLIAGEVAEVEESMDAGLVAAGEHLLDHVVLSHPDPAVMPALMGETSRPGTDSVCVVETTMAATAIRAADAALKATGVRLIELRLATGLGGKAYFVLGGSLHLVEEAADVGTAASAGALVGVEIIANPDPLAAERMP